MYLKTHVRFLWTYHSKQGTTLQSPEEKKWAIETYNTDWSIYQFLAPINKRKSHKNFH